jgi:hypothetical protein
MPSLRNRRHKKRTMRKSKKGSRGSRAKGNALSLDSLQSNFASVKDFAMNRIHAGVHDTEQLARELAIFWVELFGKSVHSRDMWGMASKYLREADRTLKRSTRRSRRSQKGGRLSMSTIPANVAEWGEGLLTGKYPLFTANFSSDPVASTFPLASQGDAFQQIPTPLVTAVGPLTRP